MDITKSETFIAICAHFVESTGVLKKALLALPYLPGKHSGDKQVKVLWQVLKDYKLLSRIGYCVGNNHSSNDKLLQRLSTRLKEKEIKAQYNAQQHHICCHRHILNIAAQAFFFTKNKKAVNAAFKETHKKLKAESDLKDNQIKEILAKRFQKEKASKFTYHKIGSLGKIYNVIMHI